MPKTEAEKLGAEMGLALNMATRFRCILLATPTQSRATFSGVCGGPHLGFHGRNRRAKIIKERSGCFRREEKANIVYNCYNNL